jgi:hypothetical protein
VSQVKNCVRMLCLRFVNTAFRSISLLHELIARGASAHSILRSAAAPKWDAKHWLKKELGSLSLRSVSKSHPESISMPLHSRSGCGESSPSPRVRTQAPYTFADQSELRQECGREDEQLHKVLTPSSYTGLARSVTLFDDGNICGLT